MDGWDFENLNVPNEYSSGHSGQNHRKTVSSKLHDYKLESKKPTILHERSRQKNNSHVSGAKSIHKMTLSNQKLHSDEQPEYNQVLQTEQADLLPTAKNKIVIRETDEDQKETDIPYLNERIHRLWSRLRKHLTELAVERRYREVTQHREVQSEEYLQWHRAATAEQRHVHHRARQQLPCGAGRGPRLVHHLHALHHSFPVASSDPGSPSKTTPSTRR